MSSFQFRSTTDSGVRHVSKLAKLKILTRCHYGGDNKILQIRKSVDLMVVADLDLASSVICRDGLLATNVESTQKIDVSEILPRWLAFK